MEIGTNHPGEVAALRAFVEPDVAIVTSIGEEHLEGLGDLAGVLREESAVFDGVRRGDRPGRLSPRLARRARSLAQSTVSAGLDAGDVRPDSWTITPDGAGMLRFGDVEVRPPLRGEHNLRNAMLAIAVARALGVSMEDAAAGIARTPALPMRSAWVQIGALHGDQRCLQRESRVGARVAAHARGARHAAPARRDSGLDAGAGRSRAGAARRDRASSRSPVRRRSSPVSASSRARSTPRRRTMRAL